MSSEFGESQTSIAYAPHMYVLKVHGNPFNEEHYTFLGNAEVSVNYPTSGGAEKYHLGLSGVTSELVCERLVRAGVIDWISPEEGGGVELDTVPQEVYTAALRQSLSGGVALHLSGAAHINSLMNHTEQFRGREFQVPDPVLYQPSLWAILNNKNQPCGMVR